MKSKRRAPELTLYAHRIRGDRKPFYFGSGRPDRPRDLSRGAEWNSYVTARLGADWRNRIDEIEVERIGEYSCEGQMRFDECMLAAEGNAPGNRVGAAKASVDMLTGLLKGARPCRCGGAECRRVVWLAMTPQQQDREMRRQLELCSRNRVARGESPTPVEAKMREHENRRRDGHHWFRDA